MSGSIEDFVSSLPIVNWDEARRIYEQALNTEGFPKIQLEGAHEQLRAGVQMVYVIGRGKICYNGLVVDRDSLFYFSCLTTKEVGFKRRRNNGDVDAIPLERIDRIKLVQVSSEDCYEQ